MSKARKKRDNQVYIKDIAEWKETVAKPILLVAEIFAPHFGPCEIMFPFIDELMVNLDGQGLADKVHWAIVNVIKLEDEKAVSNAEDALKKQETKIGEKPKEESQAAVVDDATGTGTVAEQHDDEPDNVVEGSEQLDSTIPNLEKYAGFNHPTPHYVFFRNGVVIDELRGANPPRLEQLVRKWISAEPPVPVDIGVAESGPARTEVPPIQDPDLAAMPPEERPRRGSMSLYAPDDDQPSREPSPERGPVPVAAATAREAAPVVAAEAEATVSEAAPPASVSAAPSPAESSTSTTAPGQIGDSSERSPNDSAAAAAAAAAPAAGDETALPQLAETKMAESAPAEAAPGASDLAEMLKQEPPTIPI